MATKLYVGNLPFSTTTGELEELFATYGEVVDARVITDRETGRSRGFGFVELSSDDAAKKAIDELNDSDVDGRRIVVDEAREQQPRGPR